MIEHSRGPAGRGRRPIESGCGSPRRRASSAAEATLRKQTAGPALTIATVRNLNLPNQSAEPCNQWASARRAPSLAPVTPKGLGRRPPRVAGAGAGTGRRGAYLATWWTKEEGRPCRLTRPTVTPILSHTPRVLAAPPPRRPPQLSERDNISRKTFTLLVAKIQYK